MQEKVSEPPTSAESIALKEKKRRRRKRKEKEGKRRKKRGVAIIFGSSCPRYNTNVLLDDSLDLLRG
ncbi:hypothetical protein AV530_013402 [Patagioenas fasciata monilis]|uniref:Uncharacterized protein n=1 Tax=Patagioenas fasciata monilis TaxID=372326 RepID=A0A1V4JQI8_PATFA|nr:hypothetical protein AV530_013402 [Patagioenas fasciata monilis]